MNEDPSNGYEAIAEDFIAVRSSTGQSTVKAWAARCEHGSKVVDIGAGYGEPLVPALLSQGLRVWAIDASPSMVAAFQKRFPSVPIACEAAEDSRFFGLKFDAALANGLIFLMPAHSQQRLLRQISNALAPGGRLLFSAPHQVGSWDDLLTGKTSYSLGADTYKRVLVETGFKLCSAFTDETGTHYYDARRT